METEPVKLPRTEIFASFCIYAGTVLFALYKAFEFGGALQAEGWRFLHQARGGYDEEWLTFVENIEKDVYWLLAHVVISEICRFLAPMRVHIAHAAIGIAFAYIQFDGIVFALMVAMNITYYDSVVCGKLGVWCTTASWRIIFSVIVHGTWADWLIVELSSTRLYSGLIVLAGLLLRTKSFALDYCEAQQQKRNQREMTDNFSIWRYLGYTFYLPVFRHGPPLVYCRYVTMWEKVHTPSRFTECAERLKRLIVALIWLGGIHQITVLFAHYIHAHVIVYSPFLMQGMSSLTMYGFGYAIGQLFCNRYIIMYGMGIALARFDRIDAPDGPRCFGRTHQHSHTMRYFDQGLYDFLFRYIYCELCTTESSLRWKAFATFMTFSSVCLWHGADTILLVWMTLNLALLAVEQLQRYTLDRYRADLQRAIGHRNILRLNAIIGSQLVLPSIIVNLMFVGGREIGQYFAQRTYSDDGLLNYFLFSVVAYNFYQYSSAVHARERRTRTS